MSSLRFELARRFALVLDADESEPITAFFRAEYAHLQADTGVPVVGRVRVVPRQPLPDGARVFVKGELYADDERLYIGSASSAVAVGTTSDGFELVAPAAFDAFLVFHFTEILIRLYATRHGVVFLHASGFHWRDRTCVICAYGGTGKTNLLLDVLADGGHYLGDDLVPVTADGLAGAYPKRLNLLHYNFAYRPELLSRIGRSRLPLRLLHVAEREDATSFWYRLTLYKLVWRAHRALNIKVDHARLAVDPELPAAAAVDRFVWLERTTSAHSECVAVDHAYVGPRLLHCLQLEDRTVSDILGFAGVLWPHIADLVVDRAALLCRAVAGLEPVGVRKGAGDDSGLTALIAGL